MIFEPYTLGIVVAVVVCFVVAYFIMNSNRDGFEQLFDADARKLLNQDDKPKNKGKMGKSKMDPKKKEIIDIDKFFSRLYSIGELEPDYTSFIHGHLQILADRIESLEASVTAVQHSKAGVENKIELHKNARVVAEGKLADLKVEMSELNAKIKKVVASEHEISCNLSATQKRLNDVNVQLTKIQEERSKLVSESTKLTQDLQTEKKRASELAAELKEQSGEIATLVTKNNDLEEGLMDLVQTKADYNAMKTRYEEIELRDKLLEDKLINSQKLLEEQRLSNKASVNALKTEREDIMNKWKEDKRKWELEEQLVREEYHTTKKLIGNLSAECEKFEIFKKEQNTKLQHYATMEKTILDLEKTITGHEQEISNLRMEKTLLKDQIQLHQEHELVMVSKDDGQLNALTEENLDLKELSENLRQQNTRYMVEMNEKAREIALISESLRSHEERANEERMRERRVLADLLAPLAQQPIENFDLEKFSTWLGSTISSFTPNTDDTATALEEEEILVPAASEEKNDESQEVPYMQDAPPISVELDSE